MVAPAGSVPVHVTPVGVRRSTEPASWTTRPVGASAIAFTAPAGYGAVQRDGPVPPQQHDLARLAERRDDRVPRAEPRGDRGDPGGVDVLEDGGARSLRAARPPLRSAYGIPRPAVESPIANGDGSSTSCGTKRSCLGVFWVVVAVISCQSRSLPPL